MKIAGVLVTLAVVCFGLQGCATTDATRTAAGGSAGAGAYAAAPDSTIKTTDSSDQTIVKADTKDNFEAVAAAIDKQMAPGGRWQFVTDSERSTINGNFADMRKLYDQYGSVDKMDPNAKMRLASDQSSINAILTRKDGDRLICETTIPVGSHFPVKTCKTYAQIQIEQGRAQQFLRERNAQNSQQVWSGH